MINDLFAKQTIWLKVKVVSMEALSLMLQNRLMTFLQNKQYGLSDAQVSKLGMMERDFELGYLCVLSSWTGMDLYAQISSFR